METREKHIIDATNRPMGRVATEIAMLLRGKNKPTFQPHLDEGGFVIVNNVSKIKITGRKLKQKLYSHHTGYAKGFRQISLADLLVKKPQEPLKKAVMGMLPKNKLRDQMIKRLKINLNQ
ncbi:MAG: 50S ribosomal protein L13 [Candidatus Gribaldobacteria bacterium]|nr:50S ribosomal protein L13 [Candidatus Gribaldobacteria bacterium]